MRTSRKTKAHFIGVTSKVAQSCSCVVEQRKNLEMGSIRTIQSERTRANKNVKFKCPQCGGSHLVKVEQPVAYLKHFPGVINGKQLLLVAVSRRGWKEDVEDFFECHECNYRPTIRDETGKYWFIWKHEDMIDWILTHCSEELTSEEMDPQNRIQEWAGEIEPQ